MFVASGVDGGATYCEEQKRDEVQALITLPILRYLGGRQAQAGRDQEQSGERSYGQAAWLAVYVTAAEPGIPRLTRKRLANMQTGWHHRDMVIME